MARTRSLKNELRAVSSAAKTSRAGCDSEAVGSTLPAAADRASSRKKIASGATRVGRTAARPLRVSKRRMRRQPAPHDFAGQAQTIQQFRIVLGDAPRQHDRFPRRRGNFIALQLPQNLKQAVDAVQLRAGRNMLPAAQEAHEARRR